MLLSAPRLCIKFYFFIDVNPTIADHISDVFNGNNWTDVSIVVTIEDITWQQAQQQTKGSANTIASLLHHLYYWNGIIEQRMQGNNPTVPEANGFDVEIFQNENDWNNLKEKTHRSFIDLSNAVQNFPDEKLTDTYAAGKSSYYKTLQGIVEHAHYHLGQIAILKNLLLANDV